MSEVPVVSATPTATPRVSVVVPSYNKLRYLQVTVRSILAQTEADLELIVVDEASVDGTPAWLDAHPDPRLRVIHHERPMGACTSRNDGIAAARGGFIAFCDHDDVWAPTKLERQLDALEATGTDWSSVVSYVFDEQRRITEVHRPPRHVGDIADLQLYRNVIPGGGSAVVARRQVVERAGGFDPSVTVMGDWHYWNQLALHGPFVGVQEPLIGYRQTATGMSASLWPVPDIEEMKRRYAAERARRDVDFDEWHQLWWAFNSYSRTPARSKMVRLSWVMVRKRLESPSFLAKAALQASMSGWAERRREVARAAALASHPPMPGWLHALLDTEGDDDPVAAGPWSEPAPTG